MYYILWASAKLIRQIGQTAQWCFFFTEWYWAIGKRYGKNLFRIVTGVGL